jgi:hypothetical protein
MTSIDLTILSCTDKNREKAEGLRKTLQGKTFMDFDVTIAPVMGNLLISVATDRINTSKKELYEMVVMIMAETLMGFNTDKV